MEFKIIMKKPFKILFLASLLVACVLVLASCMNSYRNSLESEGYEITEWDADDISNTLKDLGAGEHEITEAFSASKGVSTVYVLKLGSSSKASDLANDIDASYLSVKTSGNVVFIGSSDAIEIAMK